MLRSLSAAAAALALLVLASACFSPNLGDQPFRCGTTDPRCPSGYHCASDEACWANGTDPDDAAPDAPPLPDAPAADAYLCTPGGTGCMGADLITCDGDAAPTQTSCPLGCTNAGPAPHCLLLVPSNINAAMSPDATCANPTTQDQDVPATTTWTINTDSDCTFTQTQTGGPELCIVVRRNIHVPATATVRAAGPRALLLLATGEVTLDGLIDVTANHEVAGPGAATASGNGGNGDCGGSLGAPGQCGGGGGGHGTEGAAGSGTGSPGGGSPGGVVGADDDLQPLTAGGNGGSNSEGETLTGGHGGAVQISACASLTVGATAVINAGGGGGGGGAGTTLLSLPANGGGGGGSGGGVLLESPSVVVTGGANLAANGGAGGGGGGTTGAGMAPNGLPGTNAGLGTTPATGGAGGIAMAGVGGPGATSASAATSGTVGTGNNGHGGGGGAVGRIRFNSQQGQLLDLTGTTISPAPSKGTTVLQ